MDWVKKFSAVSASDAKSVLEDIFHRFCDPAFGALPKREIELLVFDKLKELGIIQSNASVYDLMRDLRVTRTKATSLIYDSEVRRAGDDDATLDAEIKEAIKRTKFAKDGDYFVLEIENPLIQAHLRNRFRQLGHITDTSFNSAIVRAPLDAISDIILDFLAKKDHATVKKALVAAGAPDKSIKGVLMSSLKTLGQKFIGKAADQIVEGALEPILSVTGDAITDAWRAIFEGNVDN